MTPIRDKSPHPKRWEEFLKAFTARVAKPTSFLLSARCITKQTLSGIFSEIQQELNLPSTFPSGVAIIEHLISMGFASRIPVEGTAGTAPSKEFILLGIQESQDLDADPLELLQAYDQQGTICYFSALAYFNLTTPSPSASPRGSAHQSSDPQRKRRTTSHDRESKENNYEVETRNLPLHLRGGTLLLYKKVKSSIPGIKIRVISPGTNLRITTIEQTLLNTLQYPFHCGGQEVALEAWERHIGQIDGDLLLDYLRTIRIDPLTRRVGAIFDLFGIPPAKDLHTFLKRVQVAHLFTTRGS